VSATAGVALLNRALSGWFSRAAPVRITSQYSTTIYDHALLLPTINYRG
jgi:hypothetical protein